jgi:prevent-host-death family protein
MTDIYEASPYGTNERIISTVFDTDRFAMNTLTVAELKRRGMAAIEDGLRRGPLHIVKRNRPAAVVLSEEEYQRLAHGKSAHPTGITAVQWLLNQPTTGKRSKAAIDVELKVERNW